MQLCTQITQNNVKQKLAVQISIININIQFQPHCYTTTLELQIHPFQHIPPKTTTTPTMSPLDTQKQAPYLRPPSHKLQRL